MFTVPTVDLAPYVDPDGADDGRRRTATALDEACRTVGFVQVVGHGVPDAVVDGLATASDDLFALPLPEKKALVVEDGTNRGYSPPRSESVSRVKPPIEHGPGGGLRIRRRRSAAFFHDGDLDAKVETLPLDEAHPYPPTTVREHLDAKLAGSRGGTLNTAADREAARVREAARA